MSKVAQAKESLNTQSRVGIGIFLGLLAILLIFITGFLFLKPSGMDNEPSLTGVKLPTVHYAQNLLEVDELTPLLESYCFDCHMDGSDKGGLDLDSFPDLASMRSDRATWAKIRDHVEWKLMPPIDKQQPDETERQKLVEWIDHYVFATDHENIDPGPVVARRLNRTEYKNTLNDLLKIHIDISSLLPSDDSGDGFDNHAGSLSLSSTHVEKYLQTTELALAQAFQIKSNKAEREIIDSGDIKGTGNMRKDAYALYSNDRFALLPFSIKTEQLHAVEVVVSENHGGGEFAKIKLKVNGHDHDEAEVKATHPKTTKVTFNRIKLKPSDEITLHFTNDYCDRDQNLDRNVLITSVELIPEDLSAAAPVELQQTAFTKAYEIQEQPNESVNEFALRVLEQFGEAAFRRPLSSSELKPYLRFIDLSAENADSHLHGVRLAMQAMLLSRDFIFIDSPERHANYTKTKEFKAALITENALAVRLAYFLWSAPPDQQLMDLAKSNQLRNQLSKQITRMLESPKASALIENFAGQWLQTRDLDSLKPDRETFPEMKPSLIKGLQHETRRMLEYVLLGDKPMTDLIYSKYSFMNEEVANYYNLTGVKGSHFRKVDVSAIQRGGILTHGSILMLTSTPTRTSPVIRGKWLLDNILDTPPPAPPGDIPSLEADQKTNDSMSLREQLELHREQPACAACHKMMDPIGFAFESYDAIGQWRNTQTFTEGELFTGEKFKSISDLQHIIMEQKSEEFARCIAKKLLQYALGRSLEYDDRPVIEELTRSLLESNFSFHELVRSLILSIPFQKYRSYGA